MTDELTQRIAALGDENAAAALAFALDADGASQSEVDRLRDLEAGVPEAFATSDLELDPAPPPGTVSAGDLARAALLYLASRDDTRPDVEQAIAVPRREGQREPFLLIGGLAVLALRSDIEFKRTTTGKWSFHYRWKPMSDTLIVSLLTKLHAYLPESGGGAGGAAGGTDGDDAG